MALKPLFTALRQPSLAIGAVLVCFILLCALLVPMLSPYAADAMDMRNRFAGPSAAHWLGTDNFGRDIATRLAMGARVSLVICVGAVAASLLAGTASGLLAGYFGGWADLLLMRITDIFLGFPALILSLAVIAAMGAGATTVAVALALNFWSEYSRVVRATTLSLREQGYVLAARSMGASHRWILLREILPNTIGPIVVLATLNLGTAIMSESALSFLGFGVPPPTPTWGWTLANGTRFLRDQPWLATVTGMTIMGTVLGFNLLGDGLRDLLDPRQLARGLRAGPAAAGA